MADAVARATAARRRAILLMSPALFAAFHAMVRIAETGTKPRDGPGIGGGNDKRRAPVGGSDWAVVRIDHGQSGHRPESGRHPATLPFRQPGQHVAARGI